MVWRTICSYEAAETSEEMNKKLLLLLSALIYLNILDIFTTYVGLSLGGKELNPSLNHYNVIGITFIDVVGKIGATIGVCLLIWLVYRKATKEKSKLALTIVYGLTIGLNPFFLLVVLNNVCMLNFQIQEVMMHCG